MVRIERITKIESVLDLIAEQQYDQGIERYRSSFLYRGLPNKDYKLDTSLHRNCKEKQSYIEKCILRNFTKYAAIEDPRLAESIWRQLIIGQHHGLPTRLLDWTYSSLIGLHFATSGEDLSYMEQHDSILWKIDILEINSLLPYSYRKALDNEKAFLFTVDMLEKLVNNLEGYDEEMKKDSMVLLEPPSIDQRIINQYSYFAVIPIRIGNIEEFLDKKTNNTVKYVIDKNIRWEIRDLLDHMNINERIIYPGLDGLSSWLKRHYYVKPDLDETAKSE